MKLGLLFFLLCFLSPNLFAALPTNESSNLKLKKSLPFGFKSYGVETVTRSQGAPVRTGDSSIRFEVRSGDCGHNTTWNDCTHDRQRHEYTSQKMSGEVWVNWSVFVPKDFPNLWPATVTLGQFHQHNSSTPPFMFQVSWAFVDPHGGYRVNHLRRDKTLENKPLVSEQELLGKWTDILVHVNWQTDQTGYFRVYVNGENTPRYRFSGSTLDPKAGVPYFKFGIYQSHISRYLEKQGSGAKTPTQVVFYDDVFEGKHCSDVSVYFDCKAIKLK